MDLNLEYRLMCLEASEVQNNWKPEVGDFMLALAPYCSDDNKSCTDNKPCSNCLEMDNHYVISGKDNFAKSIGGAHWFFDGSACVKGEGNICNDTHCSIMTESGYSTIVPSPFRCSKEDMLWLPRQDQIQAMFLNGLTNIYKIKRFIGWMDIEVTFNTHTYSLEMLWLMFYMDQVHSKQWNPMENVKRWEVI